LNTVARLLLITWIISIQVMWIMNKLYTERCAIYIFFVILFQ
jgi:hypothetical protein